MVSSPLRFTALWSFLMVEWSLADLPVHCPRSTIVGVWEVRASVGDQAKGLRCASGKETTICQYGSCFKSDEFGPAAFSSAGSMIVRLSNPDRVDVVDVSGVTPPAARGDVGTWTTVYDEGFLIRIGGREYFSFSKFDGDTHASDCQRTWPGWHAPASNPDSNSWGCFSATQRNATGGGSSRDHTVRFSRAKRSRLSRGVLTPSLSLGSIRSKTDNSMQFSADPGYIRRINLMSKGRWKATHYPQLESRSIAHVHRLAGSRLLPNFREKTRARGAQVDPVADRAETERLMSLFGASMDWRNANGTNYVDAVIAQSCGDCYAAATVSMINSRVRILTQNRVRAEYDHTQVVRCDPYNQGCAGGYPFLAEKFIRDFGLTRSGKCAMGSPMALPDAANGTTEPEVRVESFGYIGGFYGGATTEAIMREIKFFGPVAAGIGGSPELLHYKNGIYSPTGARPPPPGSAGHVMYDFEPVNHAVVIVGWGRAKEGDRDPYWILKNSYGNWWGEKGYFRIPLLGDARNIQSLVTAAKPVFGGKDYFLQSEAQRRRFHSHVMERYSREEGTKGFRQETQPMHKSARLLKQQPDATDSSGDSMSLSDIVSAAKTMLWSV